MYKTRCDVLEEKLATVTKEKAGLIDRLEEETRKKSGIRTTKYDIFNCKSRWCIIVSFQCFRS
jgi:hypothetical protein